jgi:hypothetical protein
MPKGTFCPEFPIQQTGQVPTIITWKSLNVWSQTTDHQKYERVAYRNGIQDFQNFGLAETQKLSSILLLFCPEQNSATMSIFKIP